MSLGYRRLILVFAVVLFSFSARSQCQASLNIFPPSCSSPGGYILIIPNTPACTGPTPYTLDWPLAPCGQPTLTTVPGPGTFAVTFTAGCLSGYVVNIRDNNGTLIGGAGNVLGPSAPSTLTFALGAQQQPACFGNCNGSQSLFWNTSASPLSVTLTSPTGAGTVQTTYANVPAFALQNYTALCAGVHSFVVRDNNNCTFSTSLTFTITQPTSVTATSATRAPTCNGGNNGSFSVVPANGTPNYTVAFSNNTSVTVAAGGTAVATGYTAGAVSATVTDSRGCTRVVNNTISQPTSMTITSTQASVNCASSCNGSATVTVTGGGGGYTYTWSPGPGNAASINSLCAGTHTVNITDANGCIRQHTLAITQPTSIAVSTTVTNLTCNNVCTGAATVSASGPSAVSYTWLAPPAGSVASTSSVLANRCAGLYTLQASTNPTCVNSFSVAITQPPALTLTALTSSVNCPGFANGSATANISGGNGTPYSFTWTSASGTPAPQTGSTVAGLTAQVYTLSARDASNCVISRTLSITQPPAFGFGVTTTSINCNGACTGAINTSPSGGTPPYNYTLASGTSTVTGNSPVFTNLCAGTYTLRVADNTASCPQSTVVQINQPTAIVPTVNVTHVSCSNVCNGGLSASASGGSPGYTLSWNTPTGTATGTVLSNRCAGTYTLNVTDSKGCAAPPAIRTLTAPPALTVNVNVTNASCFAQCNGVLSATASGGTPGYTLSWSNGFTGNPNVNRCAGNYTLTVRDANSCTTAVTASVTQPASITITRTITTATCAGSCNASASVTAVGGAGSYTFQFSPAPLVTNTTGILSGRCAGNYVVNVTDANNCTQAANFTINNPVSLSAAITGTRNSCTTCTGASTVTPANGVVPYTFAWTNSLNVTVSTASTAAALCPGTFTARVTDSKSCVATATVNISQIVISSAIAGGTGIQCFGACTASAVASAAGGLAPYSFTWTPSAQNSATATNLCAGNYTVRIRDNNSPPCENTATIAITQPSSISVVSSQTNITCFNTCDGAIGLSVSGGTGAKTFSWSPGGMTTPTVTGLCQGVYTVQISDANNCPRILTFTLNPPFPPITAVVNPTNPTNCGTPNNGVICINPGGGTGVYSYTWSPPVAGNVACASALLPGTYSIIVGSGACTNTFMTILSSPLGPSLTLISSQTVSCFNGNNGAVTYSASGIGPYTFTWTPAVPGTTTTATTSGIGGVSSGTYVLSSTDIGNSCVTTQSFVVTQPTSITVNGTAFNVRCSGATCSGSIATNPSGGRSPYTFAWSGTTATTPTLSNICAGNYTVTVTDNNGCQRQSTFNISVPPAIAITATTANVRCFGACNGSIIANATGGTGALSYSWLPVGAFSGSTTATVINLCPNNYSLVASDVNSCQATQTFTITEPSELTSTLNVQQVSCNNICDGAATLTASGGVPTYSFAWSSGPTTVSALNGLCAGNYTGTVTDANGCTSAKGFTLLPPSVLSVTLTPSNPRCNAACNGSISTVVTGNQGALTFVWSPAGSGQNPTGLCAGDYTLTASDAQGCQITAVTSLVNPPALLANVTTTAPTCDSSCNGIAVSTPANAVAPVSFTWLPSGPSTATNTGLCAGTYTVSLEDANNCQFSQTFAVTAPPSLSINPILGLPTCGSSNGSITAAPVGGTPGYTFTWLSPGPPIATSGSVATGLGAGIYTISITDANSCSNIAFVPLSNSNGPTAPVTSTNITCSGDCTGAASVGVISGGTPPYALPVWILPTPSVQSAVITSLCANGYTVALRDNNNCVTFTGTSISEPPAVNIQPFLTMPSCQGVCNGTITVSTTGGIAPYTYTWLPGSSTTSVLTGACAGTQTVLIGYNSGSCVSTQLVNVPATSSIAIAPPLVTDNNCFGECRGSATVQVLSTPGGSPSLSWNNGQIGNTAINLCNGTYSVLVADAQGCNDTFTVPIISPSQLGGTSILEHPDCGRCNGSATISGTGGTGPNYSYNWTNGASQATVENLCAGVYQVQVTDALNCKETVNVLINNSSGINGENVSVVDESCPGPCNGSATVSAIGGNAPVTYSWLSVTPAVNDSTAANLCAGSYFVQMTDAEGCVRIASLTIAPASELTVSPFVIPPACGATDGSINIVVSGGQPSYNFAWTPAAPNTSSLTNLGPGNYTVVVTDQNGSGCAKTEVVSLSNPDGPTFSETITHELCAGDCNGAIVLTSTFSPAPVFAWSNGQSTTSINGLCPGVVTLTASANGCETVRSFSIEGNPALDPAFTSENSRCAGECSGVLSLHPTGGTLPYTFAWTPSVSGSSRADSLCTGVYSVVVTDAVGCSAAFNGSVSEAPLIAVTSTITNSSCGPTPDGTIAVNVSGGAAPVVFLWNGPDSFTSGATALNGVPAGNYTLQLTDSLGCSRDTMLTIIPTVTLIADAGNDFTVCPGTDVVLTGTNSQGAISFSWKRMPEMDVVSDIATFTVQTAVQTRTFELMTVSTSSNCIDTDHVVVYVYETPYLDAGPSYTMPVYSTVTIGGNPTTLGGQSFTWSPSTYLSDAFSENPVASNTIDVTYTVSMAYGDGCLVSDTMQVILYPEIQITSGFSPNGDGINDFWIIDYIEQFPENTVEIYNRWGERLFNSKGYEQPFDGRYKGQNLPVGTYYYVIILNHPAYPKAYTGPVTIFR